MPFWRRGKGKGEQAGYSETGQVQKAKRTVKRGPPVALEVKLLAMEALQSDLSLGDVAEIIGVTDTTLSKWRQQYQEGGVEALCRRASSVGVRKQCSLLEERILAHRREYPEHGVRRIRDELRRGDGVSVSAEKVRTVVNDAGLGNQPPTPGRQSPQDSLRVLTRKGPHQISPRSFSYNGLSGSCLSNLLAGQNTLQPSTDRCCD